MADVLPVDAKGVDRLAPGTRLGRYELLLPVARGGMARVWAARQHGQRGFTKLVAVKTILPHLSKVKQFEHMFVNEARVASFVQHPNVCQIIELGEEAQTLYMAMEWITGDSLARVLKASGRIVPLDPRIVARVLADACAGLHAAHFQGDDLGRPLNIVHRDVSPHNIMLSADGTVKMCDFGVAKALGQLQDATLAGQIKGKLSYMPPEQFMGGGLDGRADIFAMGVVAYEATTGRQPFEGDNDLQVMQRLARGDYAHPSLVVGGYPHELEQIIVRAMQPEPANRFSTAEQMRIALEEWLARSGPIVTQTNVAYAVRERIGTIIDARRDQIMAATQGSARPEPWGEVAGHTPSNLGQASPQPQAGGSGDSKSGVMARNAQPLNRTVSLPQGSRVAPTLPPSSAPSAPNAPPGMTGITGMTGPNAQNAGTGGPQMWWDASQVSAGTPAPGLVMNPLGLPQAPMPMQGVPSSHPFTMPPSSAGPSGPSSLAPPVPGAPVQSSGASYYSLAIGLGVVIAGLIGGGAYVAWARLQHRAPDPVAIVSVPPITSGGSALSPSSAPIATPSVPPTAVVAPVDTSAALDAGVAIAPAMTATVVTTARPADVVAPVNTPDPQPTARPRPTATATPTAIATATPTAEPAGTASSKSKPAKPAALPDNPY